MQPKHLIIAIIFLTSAILYYNLTDPTQTQTSQASRIIDGDTIQTTDNIIIRLIGINTPEKSQPLFQEATNYLTTLILNKSIELETYGTDKYNRVLAHIFLDDKNINAQILKQGLATLYYYEKDQHYQELKQAEEFARLNQKGLWQKSPDSDCIEIIEFKTDEPESLTLKNNCDKILNITFKDDATHIYKTLIQPKKTYTKNTSHIWNTDGDSIYIRDTEGLLLFYRY